MVAEDVLLHNFRRLSADSREAVLALLLVMVEAEAPPTAEIIQLYPPEIAAA